MKRTLIALAVGAALAPAAHADVVLTGVINLGPTIHNTGSGSSNQTNTVANSADLSGIPTSGGTVIGLSRNYSWIGVGSTEDLGNGLKLDVFMQFQMEPERSGFGATGAAINNRNSRVGFVGERWGGVWWGTNENIYERYLYSTDPLDGAMGVGGNLSIFGTPGYNVVFDAGRPVGHAGFYRRTEHTLWYDSPNYGGFSWGAAWFMPAYKARCGQLYGAACVSPNAELNPWGFSIGGKWAGTTLPLEVWAAYEQHKDYFGMAAIGLGATKTGFSGVGTSSKDDGINAGIAYTLGDIRIFGMYERLKYRHDNGPAGDLRDYRRDAWGLGIKWALPGGYFGAQWLKANDGKCNLNNGSCSASSSGAWLLGLGYFHNLSKQTQVYIVGARIDNDDLASFAPAGGLGVYGGGAVLPGQSITSGTIGVKHSF